MKKRELIEKFALEKTFCILVFQSGVRKKAVLTGIVRGIFTRKGEEYAVLESGLPIKLADILSIQEAPPPADRG